MTLTDTTLAEIEAARKAAKTLQDMLPLDASDFSGWSVEAARFITLACNNAAAMVQEIRALREAYLTLQMALSEAGDDYPGSSMQEWCVQQIARAEQIRKGTPP